MSKRPHLWDRFIAWAHCVRCGMLAVNNAGSRKDAAKPCPGSDDDV